MDPKHHTSTAGFLLTGVNAACAATSGLAPASMKSLLAADVPEPPGSVMGLNCCVDGVLQRGLKLTKHMLSTHVYLRGRTMQGQQPQAIPYRRSERASVSRDAVQGWRTL